MKTGKIPLKTAFFSQRGGGPVSPRSSDDSILPNEFATPPFTRQNSRTRAGTVAVSENVASSNGPSSHSSFYVVISPPHLLSQRRQNRLRVKTESAINLEADFGDGRNNDGSKSLPVVKENIEQEDIFEEEKEVKAQLDIMNECMSNVNSIQILCDVNFSIF